jgi:GDP-mannose 6-dehydrogenase
MNLTVFGLGYVGCVTAACLADRGHVVTGVDLDETKVSLVNAGRSPILEAGLEELLGTLLRNGALKAVTQADKLGDVSLVCVGTPSNKDGSLDLGQVLRVCEELGQLLKAAGAFHVVSFRSTVVPGTVEDILIPLLEKKSGKKAGRDFGVCMNPEFLRESTALKDFDNPPFTVIGALNTKSAEAVAQLYAGIDAPLEVVALRTAEMIKYACNSFHALKVSFANEIGTLCKSMSIDSWQVMDIFCKDHKLNLSPYYLKPGFAFGGSCLPKDIRALGHMALEKGLQLPVLGSVLPSNALQMDRVLKIIERTGKKKIGMLGLSFKAGTDDLRESPAVAIVERLIGKGYSVTIYDSDVKLSEVRGKNLRFIERTLPHIASLIKTSITEVIESSDVITVCKKTPEYGAAIMKAKDHPVVVDLVRLFPPGSPLPPNYEGLAW